MLSADLVAARRDAQAVEMEVDRGGVHAVVAAGRDAAVAPRSRLKHRPLRHHRAGGGGGGGSGAPHVLARNKLVDHHDGEEVSGGDTQCGRLVARGVGVAEQVVAVRVHPVAVVEDDVEGVQAAEVARGVHEGAANGEAGAGDPPGWVRVRGMDRAEGHEQPGEEGCERPAWEQGVDLGGRGRGADGTGEGVK